MHFVLKLLFLVIIVLLLMIVQLLTRNNMNQNNSCLNVLVFCCSHLKTVFFSLTNNFINHLRFIIHF